MKKLRSAIPLCCALLALTAILGCKKDENTSSIVGEWEAREEHRLIVDSTTTPPTQIEKSDTVYAAGQGSYISFRADKSYISKQRYTSSVADSGIYSYAGTRFITLSKAHSGATPDTVTLTVSGNEFTVSRNDNYNKRYSEYYLKFCRR